MMPVVKMNHQEPNAINAAIIVARRVGFDNVHFKTLNGDTELRDDVKLVLFNEEMQFYVLY